jgi:gliding motility-associated-like protein
VSDIIPRQTSEKMKRTTIQLLFIFFLPISIFGQPHQDCINALPVCQNIYTFQNGPMGEGLNPNEINSANSCLPNGEKNDMWMIIRTQSAGKLSFVISPNNSSSDYNWSLFNLTNKNCSDLFNGNLEVACNGSTDVLGGSGTASGQTGAFSNPPYYGDLGFVFPSFNGDITVGNGETYLLNISNHTGNAAGFSIDFSNSTAVLFNPATPAFAYIEPVTCGDGALIVHFNKPIRCNSVQPSDFVLGGYTVGNVSSLQCNQGFLSSPVYRLQLTTPITNASNFTLNLVSAISDDCNNINNSDAVNFTVDPVEASAGSDFIFCKNDDINITIGDTSVNYANSLDFQWTASNPLVQSALSNANVATPTLSMTSIPADTVEMILTVTTGNCSDIDTMYLYFRDCCKNYNAAINNFQNVNCFGASTGQAEAIATGSISGFSSGTFNYQWSNTNNTFLVTGLSANINYTVTITDQLGCVDTASITLSEPNSPISSASTGDILNCFGDSTGLIDLTVGGATPPYQYLWSNGDTVQDPMNLIAGNYIVTITDANNCTITKSEQVTQPPTPISISGTGSTISCGATTGSINVSVSGGGTPYAYQWNHGSTLQDLNGVNPGTYTITVTDAYGCDVAQDFTVNTSTNLTATTTATDAACPSSPTGSATVSANGGTGPYSFLWSNNQTTSTINNLLVGVYNVTITDATGCAITASATVESSTNLSIIGTGTNVSCHNGNDGSIQTSIVTNALSTYTYQWTGTNQTTPNINNLTAGTYTVTVTDLNGCTATTSVSIIAPAALSAAASANPTTCHSGNDGTLTALASGGTSPYSYQWSNGLGITPNVSGVSIGLYTVTITDSKGCSTTASASVTQPATMSTSLTPTVIGCFGTATGAISVTTSGGTTPYSYTWSNGIGNTGNPTNLNAGTYFVTITDVNGCSVSSSTTINQLPAMSVSSTPVHVLCHGGNTGGILLNITNGNAPFSFNWTNGVGNIQNPAGLSAGNYQVTVTDANGCTATTSTIITQPNTALSATTTNGTVPCNGNQTGSVSVVASGGTASYTYNWSNGIGTSPTPSNLGAGTYTVTVTDANGCSFSTTATVTEPSLLTATATGSALLCHNNSNGTVNTSVAGGTAPYSYAWSNTASNIPNQTGLTNGIYTVTITDNNGCSTTASTSVTQPQALTVTLTPTSAACNGSNNGSIQATPTGGTAPYNYSWNNGITGNTANPTNLNTGTYSVTITDANGCTAVNSTNIGAPTAVNLALANTQPPTCNQNNGTIVVIASGGTAPYTYLWTPNAGVVGNSNTAANLGTGLFSAMVTDANGCTDFVTNISFTASPPFQLSTNLTDPSCADNNGQIEIITSNNYNYQWSANAVNAGNNNIANNLQGGVYTVTVTNSDNCDTTLTLSLNTPNLLNYSSVVTDASCGDSNGTITVNITSGPMPINYIWNVIPNPGDTNVVRDLQEGTYRVTITDGNGCTETNAIVVSGSSVLDVAIAVDDPDCVDLGSIALNPLQGTAPYNYNWSANTNAGNIASVDNLSDGTYAVTVTDALNCEQSFNFNLVAEGEFEIVLNQLENSHCPDEATGLIDITTTSANANLDYNWSNGSTNEDLVDVNGGNYSVLVTDPLTGCTDSESFIITQPDDFTVNIPQDITINPGDVAELTASADDIGVLFSWAGQNGSVSGGPTITISPTMTTTYTLSASLPQCSPRTYQVLVTVRDQGAVLIPDAFSPNNDGKNDEFFVYPQAGVEILSFHLFNKWGEIIHGKKGVSPWDGTFRDSVMPNDSYVYVLVYRKADGEEIVEKGQFLLIR